MESSESVGVGGKECSMGSSGPTRNFTATRWSGTSAMAAKPGMALSSNCFNFFSGHSSRCSPAAFTDKLLMKTVSFTTASATP
eukprot:Skav200546  [mRNA]  locus=scaffold676:367188:372346:+ [translate_table: standard]